MKTPQAIYTLRKSHSTRNIRKEKNQELLMTDLTWWQQRDEGNLVRVGPICRDPEKQSIFSSTLWLFPVQCPPLRFFSPLFCLSTLSWRGLKQLLLVGKPHTRNVEKWMLRESYSVVNLKREAQMIAEMTALPWWAAKESKGGIVCVRLEATRHKSDSGRFQDREKEAS